MYATYSIKPEEFTYEFYENLKNTFKDKEVTIYIEENDETAYLSKTKGNLDAINTSLQVIKDGNITSFTVEELIDHLIFTEKVNKGLDDSNNNRVFSAKEVENKLEKWLI